MFEENNKKRIIIEIEDLVNDEEGFEEEDMDEYCRFMKEMFLQTSGLN